MDTLLKVTGTDDYELVFEFVGGHKVVWHMRRMLGKTTTSGLEDLKVFKNIETDGVRIRWPDAPNASKINVGQTLTQLQNEG